MASRQFQVIVTGTKIGFAVKPLRSVSRKCTKEWIATVRDLCIDFDIGGQADLTSIRATDAIPAPSAFISTLPGKYQVLLRTDCKTLEWQEGTPKLPSVTVGSAPFWTNCKRVLRLPGSRDCRYDPAYPVTVKYTRDSTWTPGDCPARHCCSECPALVLFHSIAKAFWKAHEFRPQLGALYATTPLWKRRRNRATFGVGSILMGDVVTMLDVRRRFEIPAAFCQARSRKIALAALQDGTERTYDPRRQQGVSVFREEMRSFSVGDRIQFTAPANDLRVANRELGTIESIDGDGRLRLKMDSGRAVELDTHKRPHIDYGYAMTSYSSQGQTADRVLIHVDTELGAKDLLNSRMAYVAVSRGAYDAQLFTNDREKLGAAVGNDVSHSSAHVPEVKQEQPIASQREIGPRHEQGLGFGISM